VPRFLEFWPPRCRMEPCAAAVDIAAGSCQTQENESSESPSIRRAVVTGNINVKVLTNYASVNASCDGSVGQMLPRVHISFLYPLRRVRGCSWQQGSHVIRVP